MKWSDLCNGENHIALREVKQNRKLRNLWRDNWASRWKLQKSVWENVTIDGLYNI